MILNPANNNSEAKKNAINYEEIRKYLMKDLKQQKQAKILANP